MALTRKMLKAMGIEEEKVDQIIEAHTETVDALKESRDKYKADAEKIETLQGKIEELQDDAKNPWKSKYDKLKGEFDNYKKSEADKAKKTTKENAFKEFLKEVGISEKRIPVVSKVTDFDSIELDDDGKIKDAEALKKSIESEWGDFIVKEGAKGAETITPPNNTGGKTMTKEEIMAIKDTSERQKAMKENHELFGIE